MKAPGLRLQSLRLPASVFLWPVVDPPQPQSDTLIGLTSPSKWAILLGLRRKSLFVADVAQLAEQLICNQQVGSSILPVSSAWDRSGNNGGVPERPKGADCKSAG